jgi:hypothetical protein
VTDPDAVALLVLAAVWAKAEPPARSPAAMAALASNFFISIPLSKYPAARQGVPNRTKSLEIAPGPPGTLAGLGVSLSAAT